MIESLVIERLKQSVVPEARQSGGTFLVEYGRPFKAVAIAAWLIGLAIAVTCFLPSTKIEREAVVIIPTGFFLLALFLHSEFYWTRITYGVAGVEVFTRWGGQRGIAWHEIDAVQLSKPGQDHVVRLKGGGAFKFNAFMSGHQSLLDEIRTRSGAR